MKTSRILIAAALAGLALCASAFAASPPDASGYPVGTQSVSVGQHAPAANAMQVQAAQDVSPISLRVADTGSGAASAYDAWTKRQGLAAMHPGVGERELHPWAGKGGKGKGGGKTPPKRIDIGQRQLMPFTRST